MSRYHYDKKTGKVVEGPAPDHLPAPRMVSRRGQDGGISFQFPPGWDDGSGKIRHVKDGPFKGRVCFSSRREAKEISARYEGMSGERIHYDPD